MKNPIAMCLNIVTALPCEARPLIDFYRLSKLELNTQFECYSNSDKTLFLIVSGIGNINIAAATSYIFLLSGGVPNSCFLNLGIAGHQHYTIGELFLAHKITDSLSKKSFYPQPNKKLRIPSENLVSVIQADTTYAHNQLVDMEAYSFFHTASKFICHEQIQVLKVVSDNAKQPTEHIKPKFVSELINRKINVIDNIIKYLLELSNSEIIFHETVKHFDGLIENWHFTRYQQHQLYELMRRWQVVFPDSDPMSKCQGKMNSKEVIAMIDSVLQDASYK